MVLVILSVVAVAGLELAANYMNRTAYRVTQERADMIDKAIAQYVRVHNKLPCPASEALVKGAACFGKENNGSGGVGTCNDTAGLCRASVIPTTVLSYGIVPVRDLGLPLSTMVDGYGSLFYYVASGDQVYSPSYGVNNFNTTDNAVRLRSGKLDSACGGVGNLCQSRGKASYLVISFGPDRRGGRTMDSVTPAVTCATTDLTVVDGYTDTVNCRFGAALALVKNGSTSIAIGDNTFYDSRFNAGSTDVHFDDIIRWRQRGGL